MKQKKSVDELSIVLLIYTQNELSRLHFHTHSTSFYSLIISAEPKKFIRNTHQITQKQDTYFYYDILEVSDYI